MLSSNWKGLLTPLLFSSQVIFSQALSLSYLKLDHEAWLYIFYNKIKARGEKLASKNSQAISWFKGQFVFNFPYSTFWFDQNPTTMCKIFLGISNKCKIFLGIAVLHCWFWVKVSFSLEILQIDFLGVLHSNVSNYYFMFNLMILHNFLELYCDANYVILPIICLRYLSQGNWPC